MTQSWSTWHDNSSLLWAHRLRTWWGWWQTGSEPWLRSCCTHRWYTGRWGRPADSRDSGTFPVKLRLLRWSWIYTRSCSGSEKNMTGRIIIIITILKASNPECCCSSVGAGSPVWCSQRSRLRCRWLHWIHTPGSLRQCNSYSYWCRPTQAAARTAAFCRGRRSDINAESNIVWSSADLQEKRHLVGCWSYSLPYATVIPATGPVSQPRKRKET